MKSYSGFSRSPHSTAYVSHSRAFGVFAKKAIQFTRNRETAQKSIRRKNRVQNICSKALSLNFIPTRRNENCRLQIPPETLLERTPPTTLPPPNTPRPRNPPTLSHFPPPPPPALLPGILAATLRHPLPNFSPPPPSPLPQPTLSVGRAVMSGLFVLLHRAATTSPGHGGRPWSGARGGARRYDGGM
jgi:hypothetical protein